MKNSVLLLFLTIFSFSSFGVIRYKYVKVLSNKLKQTIHFKAYDKLDTFIAHSCSRFFYEKDASNVSSFIFRKKKEIKFQYNMNEIEYNKFCPLEFYSVSKKAKQTKAYYDFIQDNYKLPITGIINGVTYHYQGVLAAQSLRGLVSRFKFATQVKVSSKCLDGVLEGKIFDVKPKLDRCHYFFIDKNGNKARATILSFDGV